MPRWIWLIGLGLVCAEFPACIAKENPYADEVEPVDREPAGGAGDGPWLAATRDAADPGAAGAAFESVAGSSGAAERGD